MEQDTPTIGTAAARHVRQPRLGQAHTAEGELDLSAIYVIHHAVRRDLRDFAAALVRTPLADADSWAALADRWSQLTTALHHHTRVEDRGIWPEIARRLAADHPGHRALDAMAADHLAIEDLVVRVADAFSRIRTEPSESVRTLLVASFGRADDAIRTHLANEEVEALPLMQAHLPVELWQSAQTDAGKEYGLSDLRFAAPWSAHEMPAEQFDLAFAHGGFLIRLLLAITRGGFLKRHARAFRHLSADGG